MENPTHQTQGQAKPTMLTGSGKEGTVLNILFNLKKSDFDTLGIFIFFFSVIPRSIEVEMISV